MTRMTLPAFTPARRLSLALITATALAGCQDGQSFSQMFNSRPDAEETDTRTTKLVERDVEAPEVFSATEAGLWDGRPSLGGIWAAHPDVADPDRVIIRNQTNGKFVIGALYRREREIPGPRIQISADAAAALGMLAGQPVELNVTALRREEVAEEVPGANADLAAENVDTEALDPVAAATAALEDTETTRAPGQTVTSESAPAPTTSSLSKPYIQIGIFSVRGNADNAAATMRSNGMVPLVKKMTSQNKTFWRVVVGPATNAPERKTLLKKIHGAGF
ncbi:MAG: SPOR domain-containing protein, partial [Rhodobacteraceae bacterium]|nr:SPOR domain-containing protein [Paracoccaceae bacterium]